MTDPRTPGPPEPDDATPDNVRRLDDARRPTVPRIGPTYGPTHASTYGPMFPPTPPYGTALGTERKPPVSAPTRMSTSTRILVVLAVLVAAAIAVVPFLGVAGFLSAGDAPPPTAVAGPQGADQDGREQPEVTTPPGPEFRSLSSDQWRDLVSDPEAYIGESIVVYGVITRLTTPEDTTTVRALVGSSRLRDAADYATRASLDRTEGTWDEFAEGDQVRVYGVLEDVREDAESGDHLLVLEAAPYGIRRYR
jgi:hypothetical protein